MSDPTPAQKPNILLIMVDQMRFPRFGYGEDHGFVDPLKKIFGFQGSVDEENEFKQFFPGLWALRNNAVVLNNHKVASSACVPSRTALFTGQYGTRTKATQTDGLFKDGSSPNFPWLTPGEYPTIGHWMREYGYTSHYFGKWHVSGEATEQLNHYGFSDWNLSYPDPHGALPNNLGYYRDYQFADLVTSFFKRQGLGVPYNIANAKNNAAEADPDGHPVEPPQDPAVPWFAVSSFTNPHDIASYPVLPGTVSKDTVQGAPFTLAVPPQGASGRLPKSGTMAIELNRLGFPQDNANLPPTWNEALLNKPSCQLDYAYKMGLALASMGGWLASEQNSSLDTWEQQLNFAVEATLSTNVMGLPFTLTEDKELACRAFIQYYGYLIHEVDQHVSAVLKALDESGQADNTIVLFCPDHGECGGAHHMMMEKWHTAYEEVVHVPMLVRFPESVHKVSEGLRQISDVTSHIDILPTVLGLAGAGPEDITALKEQLEQSHSKALYPVGADLSRLIIGAEAEIKPPVGDNEREGVLFITYDTITETLGDENVGTAGELPLTQFQVFEAAVDRLRNSADGEYPDDARSLASGPVMQPNNIHCVMSKDNWKLVRYFDPSGRESDQYELYELTTDPCEKSNLLVCKDTVFPEVVDEELIPPALIATGVDIHQKAVDLMALMVSLEQEMLSTPE
ncbi:sulfatase-like hydrolase/transferase [Thalassomonas viridans]|uniref:Sulfatase-like hydrolase/transferase n=1 Tax=Thalassomonas viridans TaxID=137584 RepID=A0AAE9YXQ6_9GAMM|nr:sulfatase-like hydrolase/transferase [Thalassomonas viridans]WDE03156.1 sulfatase-like hydrolase/transferase [Thalassomonas viridans]